MLVSHRKVGMDSFIRIQSGCTRIKGTPNSWLYVYTDNKGIHRVVFLVPQGLTPEIGDTIEGGILKKLTEQLINPDVSRWIVHPRKTWGN